MATKHPEDICQVCGGENPVWSADNELFNKVNGTHYGIICPNCFVKRANDVGISMFGLIPSVMRYEEILVLKKQIQDMGEVIKELRTSFVLDSIDVRFDGITVHGDDRILSLTLSRKS